ncbi:alpha/beta hydrolase family protein [Archangium lansingense]|uniref:alpha/beta hydrolase family protein n=1 Tax=Archangium lansingense TaxID=2995310 RepID=UPI003B75DAC1
MTRYTLLALLLVLTSVLSATTVSCASASLSARAADADAELALFAYDRSAPLALETERLSVEDGVEVHKLSFSSPKGGRATGRLLVPQREGKKAGIVYMHGVPGSAEQSLPRALRLARLGAVVVAVDAPFARRNASPVSFTPEDRANQVQLIVDLQRAVDLLLERPDVEPARIAFVGGSFGGAVGSLFSGVERRLTTYVLFVADGGVISHFTSPDGSLQEPIASMPPAELEPWLAAMRPLEGTRWVGRARPGSIFFLNGREDPLVSVAKAEALHRAAGPSHEVRWYNSGHKLPDEAWRDMFQWLHQRVGTDAPAAHD